MSQLPPNYNLLKSKRNRSPSLGRTNAQLRRKKYLLKYLFLSIGPNSLVKKNKVTISKYKSFLQKDQRIYSHLPPLLQLFLKKREENPCLL
jgi:hypothetical protein